MTYYNIEKTTLYCLSLGGDGKGQAHQSKGKNTCNFGDKG
jgi:hypothetical protein